VRKDKTAGTKATPSSATRSPASIAFADTDDAPTRAPNDNIDDHTPDREADGGSGGRDEAGLP
jgi:hypothetical protein